MVIALGDCQAAFAGMLLDGGKPSKIGSRSFDLPKTVKSGKGIEGGFSVNGFRYRIDTNKVAPGEGGFHLHIYKDGVEVAKVNGKGGYVKAHKGETLLKPSEINKTVRNEINKLVKYIQRKLGD